MVTSFTPKESTESADSTDPSPTDQTSTVSTSTDALDPPLDLSTVRVVVLIFFGRESTFSIMHKYLEANLRLVS